MLIKRLWCWLTGGELVWLKNWKGEVTLRIAHVNPWEELVVKPSPFDYLSDGVVVLKDDGDVAGAKYFKQWKPYKKPTGSSGE